MLSDRAVRPVAQQDNFAVYELREWLMTHELLNGLSSAEMDQVLGLGARLTVPSGTSLFHLEDPADRLFLTERGRIRLTLPMQLRGKEEDILVEERYPGQIVGWSA